MSNRDHLATHPQTPPPLPAIRLLRPDCTPQPWVMRLVPSLWVAVSVAVLHHAVSTTTDPAEFGGSARIGPMPCSRDKVNGLMDPKAQLECCLDFALDLSYPPQGQGSGGILILNHFFGFELAIALMACLIVPVVVGAILAAPQVAQLCHNQRLLHQLGGAVLVCLPLFVGEFQAPVYDHFKPTIGNTLYRTLVLSSALTIELAVPVGWTCLLPRMPTLLSRSSGGLLFAYLFHIQVLAAVREYAVRALQWASEKAPGTLPILVEMLILLCVLLLLTIVVPALVRFLQAIVSLCYARWKGHWHSVAPTKFTFTSNEASRSRRSSEARCLSVVMLLYLIGASMPALMLALLPGKDFQTLEALVQQRGPYARRQAAHPMLRQNLKKLAGECKWDQRAVARRWNDTQLTETVLRATYDAAHSPGVCDYTRPGQNDCQAGAKGILGVAAFDPRVARRMQLSRSGQRWLALSECVAQCNMCDRCQFISFSLRLKDCSWFAKCDMAALRKVGGRFVTLPVMDAIPKAISSAGASALASMRCTHNDTRQPCDYMATSVRNAVLAHLSNTSRLRGWTSMSGKEVRKRIRSATKSSKSRGKLVGKVPSTSVVGTVR